MCKFLYTVTSACKALFPWHFVAEAG